MRNTRLGMVRELQDRLYCGRQFAVCLNGKPDYVSIAKAYGIEALSVSSDSEVEAAIDQMLKDDKPFLLECSVNPDYPSLRRIPLETHYFRSCGKSCRRPFQGLGSVCKKGL